MSVQTKNSMPSTKRQKLSVDEDNDLVASSRGSCNERGCTIARPDAYGSNEGSSDAESAGMEDEIVEAQRNVKSLKTQKRKRRATSPSRFGSTLQSLLKTDAPTNLPLSLKPSIAKRRTDEKLEGKAKKLLEGEKKEKEEKNHVADVIAGWGAERERSLRKVAQRGVVKLFNAIQQTQAAAAAAQEDAKTARGSGKPSLPTPVLDSKVKTKNTDTLAKSGGALDHDAFLQMIKAGSVVAKT